MILLLAVWILICLLIEIHEIGTNSTKITTNITNMTKPKIKGYYQPTPTRWRKIGDSILFAGTTMTGYGIINESHTFALVSLAMTVIGKTLTNFFTEDELSDSSDNIR